MRILVVEDDIDSNELLKQVFLAKGYEVDCALNGKLAIKLIENNIPDIIVSDILMPEMDGYELCRSIKNNSEYKQIPFIFYTATYTDSNDERLALKLGAARFVIKPVSPSKMVEIVEEVRKQNQVQNDGPQNDGAVVDKMYAQALRRKLDKKILELNFEKKQLEDAQKRYSTLIHSLEHDYFFFIFDNDYNLVDLIGSVRLNRICKLIY